MGSLKSGFELENSSLSMIHPMDSEELRRQGHMIIQSIADNYKNVEKYLVLGQVEPGYPIKRLPKSAPYKPESLETIPKDAQQHIVPGITHWQSPNYLACFPSSSSIAVFLGEMLSTSFNAMGFHWTSSPAATELDNIVKDWLGDTLKLPKSFLFAGNGGGVLQGTTCKSSLCTLAAARDQILNQIGKENISKLFVYRSDQTDSALQKEAQIAGIHSKNFRAIKTTKSQSFSLYPDSLHVVISSDIEAWLIPLFLCATVGTTSITAVDPVGPLCNVAKRYGIWIHVKDTNAKSASICPELHHFIDGIEHADSFSFNAHKWFFTNQDCCCLWVKNPTALIECLPMNPEFQRNKASDSKKVIDYKDWQITLSQL